MSLFYILLQENPCFQIKYIDLDNEDVMVLCCFWWYIVVSEGNNNTTKEENRPEFSWECITGASHRSSSILSTVSLCLVSQSKSDKHWFGNIIVLKLRQKSHQVHSNVES